MGSEGACAALSTSRGTGVECANPPLRQCGWNRCVEAFREKSHAGAGRRWRFRRGCALSMWGRGKNRAEKKDCGKERQHDWSFEPDICFHIKSNFHLPQTLDRSPKRLPLPGVSGFGYGNAIGVSKMRRAKIMSRIVFEPRSPRYSPVSCEP